MGEKCYGVDLDEEVTPEKVRDAIITCFVQAHQEDVQEHVDVNDAEARKISEGVVKKAFEMAGADFDKPTKGDLMKVCDHLAVIAKSFRNPEIIKEHYCKIQMLVEKIK